MLESGKRVFFQTRVDEGKLGKFRDIQEKQGRTARSLIEDYFDQLVEEDNSKKGATDGNRWQKNLQRGH